LLLASLIGWRMFERASCRATLAKFEAIQRGQTRDDVHKMLGSPRTEWTGADVLHELYWGSDVAIGPNEGRVVQDERYAHSGLWCSYLIVIGYAADGSVQSKFVYG
jgi:hypothetical protein